MATKNRSPARNETQQTDDGEATEIKVIGVWLDSDVSPYTRMYRLAPLKTHGEDQGHRRPTDPGDIGSIRTYASLSNHNPPPQC